MKASLHTALVVASILTSGCDTINKAQLCIAPARISTTVSAADREEVERILVSIATQLGLEDKTSTSRVPQTIKYFEERGPDFYSPVWLGAREVMGLIVIDLYHFHGGPGEVPLYRNVKTLLVSELGKSFGDRVKMVEGIRSPIPVRHEEFP